MNQDNKNQQKDWQEEGESLNTSSQNNPIGSSGASAAAQGRSATAQADPHSNSGLANTGTNVSYEGATAPGSGGSVGTGYASGKSAADPKIATTGDEGSGSAGRHYDKAEGEDISDEKTASDAEDEINEQR